VKALSHHQPSLGLAYVIVNLRSTEKMLSTVADEDFVAATATESEIGVVVVGHLELVPARNRCTWRNGHVIVLVLLISVILNRALEWKRFHATNQGLVYVILNLTSSDKDVVDVADKDFIAATATVSEVGVVVIRDETKLVPARNQCTVHVKERIVLVLLISIRFWRCRIVIALMWIW